MPSIVVINNRSDDNNWKFYPWNVQGGGGWNWSIKTNWTPRRFGTDGMFTKEKIPFTIQTAKKEDRLWVWEFHIRIQNQAHEMVKDMGLDSSYRDVPMMQLRMCFWGFRNWILSLALGWRLRRAIHVLVMMGTDSWNTSVALLLKRNIIYIADEV